MYEIYDVFKIINPKTGLVFLKGKSGIKIPVCTNEFTLNKLPQCIFFFTLENKHGSTFFDVKLQIESLKELNDLSVALLDIYSFMDESYFTTFAKNIPKSNQIIESSNTLQCAELILPLMRIHRIINVNANNSMITKASINFMYISAYFGNKCLSIEFSDKKSINFDLFLESLRQVRLLILSLLERIKDLSLKL